MGDNQTTGTTLPTPVATALERMGHRLRTESFPSLGFVDETVAMLDTLPAEYAIETFGVIQSSLGFRHAQYGQIGIEDSRRSLDQLLRMPALAQIFIFHTNGYVREAALRVLTRAPRSPFMLASLVMRLNDWAAPVRLAAMRCADSLFAQADPEVAATMGIALRGRWYEWTRWSVEQLRCVNSLFARASVQECLANCFLTKLDGPLATTFRYFLRGSALDLALPMLATKARQASVRATALQVMLWGQVRWKSGSRREWVDKSSGISRIVPLITRRDLPVPVARNDLIAAALRDRSATVRRTALVALTDCWQEFPELGTVMPLLRQDRSPTVRRWAGYLAKQQTTPDSSSRDGNNDDI